MQVYTYAISPYDDWHRQAWAGALVLVVVVFVVLRARAARDAAPRKDARMTTETMTLARADADRGRRGRSVRLPRRSRGTSSPRSSGSQTVEPRLLLRNDAGAATTSRSPIPEKSVTALIGPSGCGKSTFLRCLNRMNDLIPDTRVEGEVLLDGQDIYAGGMDVVALRRRVGMVFQKSNPFPKSIFDNVAYGLQDQRHRPSRSELPRARGDGRSGGPRSGTRSRTACARRRSGSPAASSSGSASRGPSRSSPRSC